MHRQGQARIGISGWRYAGWRGNFYPRGLPQRAELEFAARRFRTIEINGTFYSLQQPSSFESWAAATPPDFQFAVKGSRYITHMLRLRQIETPLANFFAQGLLQLGPRLGPILWQFPPNFVFDAGRLADFFRLLPRSHTAAAELAGRHGSRPRSRTWFDVRRERRLRHAIEIRHPSFVCAEFISLLRRERIALVVADTVAWPLLFDLTADFVYCRLHGSRELYASGYPPRELDAWARRIRAWLRGGELAEGLHASSRPPRSRASRDVYVYFDNDRKVRAPRDAAQLAARLARPA